MVTEISTLTSDQTFNRGFMLSSVLGSSTWEPWPSKVLSPDLEDPTSESSGPIHPPRKFLGPRNFLWCKFLLLFFFFFSLFPWPLLNSELLVRLYFHKVGPSTQLKTESSRPLSVKGPSIPPGQRSSFRESVKESGTHPVLRLSKISCPLVCISEIFHLHSRCRLSRWARMS